MFFIKKQKPINWERLFYVTHKLYKPTPKSELTSKNYAKRVPKSKKFQYEYEYAQNVALDFHRWYNSQGIPSCSIYFISDDLIYPSSYYNTQRFYNASAPKKLKKTWLWSVECTYSNGIVYVSDPLLFTDVVPYSTWYEKFKEETGLYKDVRINLYDTVIAAINSEGNYYFPEIIQVISRDFKLDKPVKVSKYDSDFSYIRDGYAQIEKWAFDENYPDEMQITLLTSMFAYCNRYYLDQIIATAKYHPKDAKKVLDKTLKYDKVKAGYNWQKALLESSQQ